MRWARNGSAVMLLAVSGVALVGCVAPDASPATPAMPTAHPSASTPSASSTPGTQETIEDATPEEDPAASNDAVSVAIAAVTAYCQPTRSKGEWMAGLSPHLTDAAVLAYETVDPAVVPCTSYLGNASIRDGDDAYVFRVNVPTDAGVYEAYVTRPTTSAAWRVERMAPPK